MKPLNRQEALNTAALGLWQQKKLSLTRTGYSIGSDPSCAYRGFGGTRCAVGFIIPDEVYDPNMEGRSPTHSLLMERLDLSPEDAEFLSNMQYDLHDSLESGGYSDERFIVNLSSFAKHYNLTIPEEITPVFIRNDNKVRAEVVFDNGEIVCYHATWDKGVNRFTARPSANFHKEFTPQVKDK